MSTVNNNSSAWATLGLPTGDLRITFLMKGSTNVNNHTNYSQPFEIDFGDSNYVQLYWNQFDPAPDIRLFVAFTGDNLVASNALSVGVWRKYMLVRNTNTWTFHHAAIGAGSWTQTVSFNHTPGGSINLGWMASFRDGPGNYLVPGASFRNFRIYTAGSNADLLTDLDSINPTLPNLWSSYNNGATPNPATFYVDQSGNGRNKANFGTAITDSDDPITIPPATGITYGFFFGMGP